MEGRRPLDRGTISRRSRKLHDGDFSVVNRDAGRQDLARRASRPTAGRSRYYTWDRDRQEGTFLFVHQPKLEGLPLAGMKPVTIEARDGLTLNAT